MKMKLAILAACASTLALAQADVARANYGAASVSKSSVRITDVGTGPGIVVSQLPKKKGTPETFPIAASKTKNKNLQQLQSEDQDKKDLKVTIGKQRHKEPSKETRDRIYEWEKRKGLR